jgi:hypothetical protein
MNNGSPFIFRTDKMTRHPFKGKGATMLQVHALLTLQGKGDGDNVDILNTQGEALSREDLLHCAKTGSIPSLQL